MSRTNPFSQGASHAIEMLTLELIYLPMPGNGPLKTDDNKELYYSIDNVPYTKKNYIITLQPGHQGWRLSTILYNQFLENYDKSKECNLEKELKAEVTNHTSFWNWNWNEQRERVKITDIPSQGHCSAIIQPFRTEHETYTFKLLHLVIQH